MSSALALAVADRLTVPAGAAVRVIDSDALVRSLPVLDVLADRGVTVVVWGDPVEARREWAAADPTSARMVVVDRPERAQQLPCDVAAAAAVELSVLVPDLFRGLSAAVVRQLEWTDREGALAVKRPPSGTLDDQATASLLLRALHQLDPDTMTSPAALLAGLLRFHRLPRTAPISPWLLEVFSGRVGDPLPGISTAEAAGDRSRFMSWLNAVWQEASTMLGAEGLRRLVLADGPGQLLDDYFDDGLIERTDPAAAVDGLPYGVGGDRASAHGTRVASACDWIAARLTAGQLDYQSWREIAQRWSEALALHFEHHGELQPGQSDLRGRINAHFRAWLDAEFPKLSSLSWLPSPAMIHKTAQAMESRLGRAPQALVVVDGLSLAVWRTLLPLVREDAWHVSESTSFAWIPTITSLSRQAIFAARPPASFAKSLGTTAREPELWRTFWADAQKLAPHDVGYLKVHLRNDAPGGIAGLGVAEVEIGKRVLGVVVEDVDHEVHGERLGEGAFHAAMRVWAAGGHLRQLVSRLLDEGYEIVLTSDHGFAEVQTIGVSQAGVTADAHGRFEVFANEATLEMSLANGKPPGRTRWCNHGLPAEYRVVLAPQDAALKPATGRILTHGGAALEEVIVPWVRITR